MKVYKTQIQTIFKEAKQISCPAFPGEEIIFNAIGRMKGAGRRLWIGRINLAVNQQKT